MTLTGPAWFFAKRGASMVFCKTARRHGFLQKSGVGMVFGNRGPGMVFCNKESGKVFRNKARGAAA